MGTPKTSNEQQHHEQNNRHTDRLNLNDRMAGLMTAPKRNSFSAQENFVSFGFRDSRVKPGSAVVLVMCFLCATALGISAYLSWVAATASKVYGCGGDLFDCSHVLTSRWSTVMGIPVGVPAVAMYLVCLLALLEIRRNRSRKLVHLSWQFVTFAAVSAALAAVWFISLQIFLIGHLCPWCLTAHTCGLSMGALLLWMKPAGPYLTPPLAAMSVVAIAGLIAAQVLGTPPSTYQIEYHPNTRPASADESDDNFFDAPVDEK